MDELVELPCHAILIVFLLAPSESLFWGEAHNTEGSKSKGDIGSRAKGAIKERRSGAGIGPTGPMEAKRYGMADVGLDAGT